MVNGPVSERAAEAASRDDVTSLLGMLGLSAALCTTSSDIDGWAVGKRFYAVTRTEECIVWMYSLFNEAILSSYDSIVYKK